MNYLGRQNNSKNIKNFIWYSRVSKDERSFSIDFTGFISEVKKRIDFDVIVKKNSIQIHNPAIWNLQFIANKKVKKSLLNWVKNLQHNNFKTQGKLKGNNKQYMETLLKNTRKTVGSGNEGYIEIKGNNLVKTIVKEQTDENNALFIKHNLSLDIMVPMSGGWLPNVISHEGNAITYKNNVYPLDREIKLGDFSEMFVRMIKDGYIIKDLKMDNLALVGEKLIFNDLGKSISKFNPEVPENLEWARSILRAAFFIFENQSNENLLPNKRFSYTDIELINKLEFVKFQQHIFKEANIKIINHIDVPDNWIIELYKTISENRIYSDKKIPPISSILIKDDEVIAKAKNLKTTKEYRNVGVRDDHAEAILLKNDSFYELDNLTLFITISPCIDYCVPLIEADKRIDRVIFLVSKPGYDVNLNIDGVETYVVNRDGLSPLSELLATKITIYFNKFFQKNKNKNMKIISYKKLAQPYKN